MSVWTDPIIIPPLNILIFILGFLANKVIDKKAGRHLTDLERLDYVGDKLVDTSVKHSKKVKGAIAAIMSDDATEKIETIPEVIMDNINEMGDEVIKTTGQVLSGVQLEMEHMKDTLMKKIDGLDFNNGDDAPIDNPTEQNDLEKTPIDTPREEPS